MREKHTFQFRSDVIARAAQAEADYHAKREAFWRAEYERVVEFLMQTAKVKVQRFVVTGGERADLVVDCGDPAVYKRMQEAWEKIHQHRLAAEKFRMDATVYGTQSERVYELETADVHYYRLGGGGRED